MSSSFDFTKLGGGVHGKVESAFGNTMTGSDVAMKRKILRKTFRTNKIIASGVRTNISSQAGPFRSAFHLGDPLSRQNFRCGGCNQVNNTNSNVINHKKADGVSNIDCNKVVNGYTAQEVPLQGNNNKFVADSSLYTRFKHLSATNLTYNDVTGGGDQHNASFSPLNNLRG